MSDPSKETLREISHLFLSSVRDKATNGAPRPQRTPPPKQTPDHSLDLTPDEFAQMFGGIEAHEQSSSEIPDRGQAPVPPVHALIGAHLNGKQFDRAKEYARHLALTGLRVGLIEVDASEFRVMCFDRQGGEESAATSEVEASFDPRRMNEVLEELSWDVQRWLLVLPQMRVPEARGLLRECSSWVLLSTCDHDGVISCYRTLKGLTDLWPGGATPEKPRLSLALLDANDTEQAERVAAKLVSVCQQFLNWPVEAEPTVHAERWIGKLERYGTHAPGNAANGVSTPLTMLKCIARKSQKIGGRKTEWRGGVSLHLHAGADAAPAEIFTQPPWPLLDVQPCRCYMIGRA